MGNSSGNSKNSSDNSSDNSTDNSSNSKGNSSNNSKGLSNDKSSEKATAKTVAETTEGDKTITSKFKYSKETDAANNLVWTMDELSAWEHRLTFDEKYFRPLATGQVNSSVQQSGLQGDRSTAQQSGLQGDRSTVQQSGLQGDRSTAQQSGLQGDRSTAQQSGLQVDRSTVQQSGLTNSQGVQPDLASKFVMVHTCLTTLFQRAIEVHKLGKIVGFTRQEGKDDPSLNKEQMEQEVDRLNAMYQSKLGSWDHGKFACEWLKAEYRLCLDMAKVADRRSVLSLQGSDPNTNKEVAVLTAQEEKLQMQYYKHQREACVVGLTFLDHELNGKIETKELPQPTIALLAKLKLNKDQIAPKDLQKAMDKMSQDMDSQYEQTTKLQQEKLQLERDYQALQAPSVDKTREYQTSIQKKTDEINNLHAIHMESSQEFTQAFSFFRDSFVDNVFGKLKVGQADVDRTIVAIKRECVITQEAAIKQEVVYKQEASRRQELLLRQQAENKQNLVGQEVAKQEIYNQQIAALPSNIVTGDVVTGNATMPPNPNNKTAQNQKKSDKSDKSDK